MPGSDSKQNQDDEQIEAQVAPGGRSLIVRSEKRRFKDGTRLVRLEVENSLNRYGVGSASTLLARLGILPESSASSWTGITANSVGKGGGQ